MIVLDASVLVAALVDAGPLGRWAEDLIVQEPVAAPSHLLVETAAVLRRAVRAGAVDAVVADLAHRHLLGLPVELFPYAVVAGRIWELRANITPYDAAYVALAELLGSPLATLDRRLSRAPGTRCAFQLPPETA